MAKLSKIIFITICTAIIIAQSACVKDIPVPYYAHIDSITVQNVDYNVHGSVSNKITDVWVYSDSKFIGAFNLPANIPFVNITDKSLKLVPGISENGIDNRRMEYPFYVQASIPVDWQQGTYKTLNPTVKYRDNIKLLIHEDFEAGTNLVKYSSNVDIANVTNAEKLEGNASGVLIFDTAHSYADIFIDQNLYLPSNEPCFLELNYKCDMPFELDMLSSTNSGLSTDVIGGVNPKTNWNKIYFNITNLVNSVRANSYKLRLQAVLPANQLTGYIYLDNIKLMKLK